ncbi:MAG: hypothetical protein AAFZ65_06025 [Planctomycetota bacterium]
MKTPSLALLLSSLLPWTLYLTQGGAGVQTVGGRTGPAQQAFLLTPEQAEILSHLSLVQLDDGNGGRCKTIRISGVNLQVVNGLGETASTNCLGNVIVGYQEQSDFFITDRTGSHNLVVGAKNSYASYGGAVFAEDNFILEPYATVTGGQFNLASGSHATVAGGNSNNAQGARSAVTGGASNFADGFDAAICGGNFNSATGTQSSICGGEGNVATGIQATVSGGRGNRAEGTYSVVSGGRSNRALGLAATVSGGGADDMGGVGPGNLASGDYATVSGGRLNEAAGVGSVVSGGEGNLAAQDLSTVSGGCGQSTSAACEHLP